MSEICNYFLYCLFSIKKLLFSPQEESFLGRTIKQDPRVSSEAMRGPGWHGCDCQKQGSFGRLPREPAWGPPARLWHAVAKQQKGGLFLVRKRI